MIDASTVGILGWNNETKNGPKLGFFCALKKLWERVCLGPCHIGDQVVCIYLQQICLIHEEPEVIFFWNC